MWSCTSPSEKAPPAQFPAIETAPGRMAKCSPFSAHCLIFRRKPPRARPTAWGHDAVVTDFDPATSTIFVDWFSADDVGVSEVDGNVVFSIPGNNQTTTLQGIALADLSPANFTIKDAGLAAEIFNLIGADASAGNGSGNGSGGTTGENAGGDNVTETTSPNGTADVSKADATVVVTWAWGKDTVIMISTRPAIRSLSTGFIPGRSSFPKPAAAWFSRCPAIIRPSRLRA